MISRLRHLTVTAVLAVLVALLAAPALTSPAAATAPLVGGYFIYASSSTEQTATMLDDITSTGASTVITFGTRLKPTTLTAGRPAAETFAACTLNGHGCVEAVAGGLPIRNVFTYEDSSTWSAHGMRCPTDTQVTSGTKRYTVLVIAADSEGCTGSAYDIVVTANADTDAKSKTGNLLAGARARGMSVFVGMPAPVMRTDQAWLPDTSYLDTLTKFTGRFLDNINGYGDAAAAAGFYHHVEMPLRSSSSWDSVRAVYRAQNQVLAATQPGKRALVSPYLDARLNNPSRTTLADVPAATAALADTAAGVPLIIAPQDGQGTGKVGAFTATDRHTTVDAPSAAVAGEGKYADVYEGSTGDYMRAVVAGARGRAEVWLNVEMMAATTSGAPTCEGASNGRGRTDIGRVQRQVGIGTVPGVSATIGFMWTPYVTCGGADALLPALQGRPSPTHAEVPAATAPAPVPGRRPTAEPRVAGEVVRAIQTNLLELGYEPGPADGFTGPRTTRAVTDFQAEAGYPQTGKADDVTLAQTTDELEAGWTRPGALPTPETPAETTPEPAPTTEPAAELAPPRTAPATLGRAAPSAPAETRLGSGAGCALTVGVLGVMTATGVVLQRSRRSRAAAPTVVPG